MIKKVIVFFSILFVILLLIINSRTPFVSKTGGPWTVGFNFTEDYINNFKIDTNKVYAISKLKIDNDSTVFLADPFFIKEKDTFYLFIEHQKSKPNADIALLTSTDGLNYSYKGTVLKEKFHLSYPQVFKHKNEFYMLPETKRSGNVLLYKSYNFPYDWKVVDTLISNVKLKDPSIYLSDTLNIITASDDHLNMFVYKSDSLFGEWKLHKKPIAMRGTEARCAGRIIPYERGFLLPVQNCTKGYGYGLSLYKFDFFDEDYVVKREFPLFLKAKEDLKPFNRGMHHLDVQLVGDKYYYVYDGNTLMNKDGKINLWGPLKWSYIDLLNWIENK